MAIYVLIKNATVVNIVNSDGVFVQTEIDALHIDSAILLQDSDVFPQIGDIYGGGHPSVTPQEIVTNMLDAAILFSRKLITEFAVENILLGITQLGMTNQVRKATSEIVAALNTGSLYDAIYEARHIVPEMKDSRFITDARLLMFINKIETYLNLPLSTSI